VALVEKGEIFSMSVSKRKYEEMLEEQSDKELISVNFFELTKYNCFIITS
jgi:hypothetical protein